MPWALFRAWFMKLLPPSWTDDNRLAIAIVAGASAVALAFAFLSIGKNIRRPFEPQGPGKFVTLDEQQAQQTEALKYKDTDGDGLTDYDEIYIYRTSPYIADTDSDGISDGQEVKKGTDPNCPKGQTCDASPENYSPPNSANPSDLLMGQQPGGLFLEPSTSTAAIPALDPGLMTAFDPAKVRVLLKSAGMSEAQLSKITDDQLKQVYDEALAEQAASSTGTTGQ